MPMSTDVKYFHSGMPGAPAELSYATAGTAVGMFDACLVNGFGLVTASNVVVENNICTMTFPSGHSFSQYVVAEIAGATPSALNGQHRIISTTTNTASFEITLANQTATGTITAKVAPAGWEKAFSDTGIGVYRSPNVSSTRLFFRVEDASANSYTYRVDGYENMTDANTGTGLFRPTNFHFQKIVNGGTRKWFVIANASMVYVGHLSVSDAASGYEVGCFGDVKSRKSNDAYRAFIRGTRSGNANTNPSAAQSIFDCSPAGTLGAYARDWTGIGSQRAGQFAESASVSASQPGHTPGAAYPNGPDYGLLLRPLIACESDRTVRGSPPGLIVSEQNLQGRICATNRVGTFLSDVPDLPGAVLAAIPVSFGSGTDQWYACFIDIGRDWGN